ncbi:MAG TPA: alpha/beta hydrolase [Solirubrobacteraceae bacterium]|nr:alpha/beta hydrolase [Solirubrobacteraceae bacterium]
MEFQSATAGSQRFVFADSGDGPLVVLLHGFPDTPAGWSDTAMALNAAGYRTVVPYLRGYHPDTIVPGRSYGAADTAEDAILLLDAIGAEDAVLVGHDWGASITYRASALAPARIRALCGVAIPHPRLLKPSLSLLWGARHFVTLRLPTGTWLARRNDFAYIDTLMRRWAPAWSGPDRDACLRDVKACFADPRVLDAALAYYRAASRETLERLTQPALVVGGTRDILPIEAITNSPSAFTGRCDVMVCDGAGHWPHREQARPFHDRLLSFLGELPVP